MVGILGILRGNIIAEIVAFGAVKAEIPVLLTRRRPKATRRQLATIALDSLVLHRIGIEDIGFPRAILIVSIRNFPPMLAAFFDDLFKISATHRFHVERIKTMKHRLAIAT